MRLVQYQMDPVQTPRAVRPSSFFPCFSLRWCVWREAVFCTRGINGVREDEFVVSSFVNQKECTVVCWYVQVGMLYAALKTLNASLEPLHYLADTPHLVEFDLQLVDFTEDGPEARDLGVCILYGIAGTVVLDLGGRLCLLVELCGLSA